MHRPWGMRSANAITVLKAKNVLTVEGQHACKLIGDRVGVGSNLSGDEMKTTAARQGQKQATTRSHQAGQTGTNDRAGDSGYVETHASSADSVVIRTRGEREDNIGTIKGHARGGSTQTSRTEGHSGNLLAIGSHEVAEIDTKRPGTRTSGRPEESKRDRVQGRCHCCKGKGAGNTATAGAGDRRPDAKAGIGRIGMGSRPAQGADLRVTGYRRGEVVCAPDDRRIGNRTKCEGESGRDV
jgi:hypothetical protein